MERSTSAGASPFDRLSRRSRYEALVSKYEAAAEVVRTHADTDVQLQPQDQPIAEEEPQLLPSPSDRRSPAAGGPDLEPQAPGSALAMRSSRVSLGGGGMPSTAMSPVNLQRRGSLAATNGSAGGAPPYGSDDVEQGGMLAGGGGGSIFGTGAAAAAAAAAGEELAARERSAAGAAGASGPGGVLAAGLSGALGGLASLAGLNLGGGGGADAVDGYAADAAEDGVAGEGDGAPLAARAHRKHRSERPKKAPLLSSNWLKVDYKGQDTIIRVDRHKLMHKLGVQARDLRLLDLTSATPPAILDRDKAIILSADHGTSGGGGSGAGGKGRSYVGLAGAASQVTAVAGYGSLQLPFELKVLEVCLDMTASQLDNATKLLEGEAYLNLEALTRKVSAANLEKARRIKNRLVRLTKNVESVREVLERFLNDDGDMHRLHLTGAELSRQVSMRPAELGRLSAGLLPGGGGSVADSDSSSDSSIDEAETAAVEMLLEAYFMQVDHSYNRLQTVHEYIKDTEDLVTIQLDQHRNQLITVDLALTSLTLGCGFMTVVGGYFGMNLDSGLQERGGLFKAVVLSTTLGSLALWACFLAFLRTQFY
ncbi:hypothetical protein GPECTOR_114g311 [Gonium pectorale]|uniref:Magnesium transporter n=1 Tax=Gonium pectorale TaxID=33097 RepID=A0A150G0L8_GONPE|nr:hypothetical protein GPECTOR_114g311 [Gonium pectorale]|eukprot:KXZ42860.1 hypothetical protein GPECTOR_114g311 [Gonium pectorale]